MSSYGFDADAFQDVITKNKHLVKIAEAKGMKKFNVKNDKFKRMMIKLNEVNDKINERFNSSDSDKKYKEAIDILFEMARIKTIEQNIIINEQNANKKEKKTIWDETLDWGKYLSQLFSVGDWAGVGTNVFKNIQENKEFNVENPLQRIASIHDVDYQHIREGDYISEFKADIKFLKGLGREYILGLPKWKPETMKEMALYFGNLAFNLGYNLLSGYALLSGLSPKNIKEIPTNLKIFFNKYISGGLGKYLSGEKEIPREILEEVRINIPSLANYRDDELKQIVVENIPQIAEQATEKSKNYGIVLLPALRNQLCALGAFAIMSGKIALNALTGYGLVAKDDIFSDVDENEILSIFNKIESERTGEEIRITPLDYENIELPKYETFADILYNEGGLEAKYLKDESIYSMTPLIVNADKLPVKGMTSKEFFSENPEPIKPISTTSPTIKKRLSKIFTKPSENVVKENFPPKKIIPELKKEVKEVIKEEAKEPEENFDWIDKFVDELLSSQTIEKRETIEPVIEYKEPEENFDWIDTFVDDLLKPKMKDEL